LNLFGVDIPVWVLDWAGSILVMISLVYLFTKRTVYSHYSNASLIPYVALFLRGGQLMLAGCKPAISSLGPRTLAVARVAGHHRVTYSS